MKAEKTGSSPWILPEKSGEPQILLAFAPPSPRERRVALVLVLFLFIAFLITAPFIYYPLAPVHSFIPVFETAVFISDLITSVLLFAQYSVSRSRALLILACGYLFTAFIVVPHALTFPGAFAPTGLLNAGLQSTALLYFVWHVAFPFAVIGYALLKDGEPMSTAYQSSAFGTIAASVSVVFVLVCGVTWVIIAQEHYMPVMVGTNLNWMQQHGFGIVMLLACAAALALLWIRWRSVLDLWLMVVMCVFIFEVARVAFGGVNRFSVGFYASRVYSLITATLVLLILLSEATTLYARLARSILRQRREREGRLMTMDAVTASIAHEVNQPLTAIVTNGNAALRFLSNQTPDIEETREAVKSIVSDGHRAAKVIESIRAMFKNVGQERSPLDVNGVLRDVLALVVGELQANQVSVQLELADDLPLVCGNRVQLQQVFLNLIMNALEAMNPVTDRPRLLRLKSVIHEAGNVLISIEDSGVGVAPGDEERIFDAFFTTKAQGMGMGLAFCRSVVESHEGRLWASVGADHGAVFNVLLPADKPPGN